jgi:hypothetical protein
MTVYIPLLPHTLPIGLAKQTQTQKKVEIERNLQGKKKNNNNNNKEKMGVVVIIVVPPKPSNTTPNQKNKIKL